MQQIAINSNHKTRDSIAGSAPSAVAAASPPHAYYYSYDYALLLICYTLGYYCTINNSNNNDNNNNNNNILGKGHICVRVQGAREPFPQTSHYHFVLLVKGLE